jgi:hypothetical protein
VLSLLLSMSRVESNTDTLKRTWMEAMLLMLEVEGGEPCHNTFSTIEPHSTPANPDLRRAFVFLAIS